MPRHRKFFSKALVWPIGLWLIGCGLFVNTPSVRAQSFEETQKKFLQGDYDTVIKTAEKQVKARDYGGDWRSLLIKALLTVGRYNDAHKQARAGLDDYSNALEKRLLLRETFFYQDDVAGANRVLLDLKAMIEQRAGRFQEEDAVSLGQALLLLGVEPRLVLENCFRPAEKMSPPMREAFLAAGELALQKHDYALAADVFRAGLAKFPDDPDMNGGLARAFEPGDRKEMLAAIDAALSANPKHIPSLLTLADHLIDAEEYEEAGKQLDAVLAVNPHQPVALAYKAVLAHLANDAAGEERFRAAALEFWKSNPEVDYVIGKKLSQKYRFAEGAAEQKRALEFDPTYLPARRELAEDLLRLGQTDDGWKLVEEVRAKDDYDVAIYNLMTLHDQMAKYRAVTNADFTVHMTAHEADMYGDEVLDLLEHAKETLTHKYGIELPQRTTVDIFPTQKDFAVRTFGMPDNPGYLGVCFGSVITANSPASQAANPANWKDVLWHEFCHVITLTLTKNRMPRWLSEGISVYEERQADAEWGERMNLAYREMILKGELTPLGKLSGAFLAPKNGEYLQFAYYESSLVVEYIVKQYGMDSLKAILKDLGDGKEINAAIAAHTTALADLEKQFDTYAHEKAKNLAPGVDLEKPPQEVKSTAEIKTLMQNQSTPPPNPRAGGAAMPMVTSAWDIAHPKNYYVRMEAAEKMMEDKDWTNARPALESLVADYHGEHRAENPLWLLAVTEKHLNDTNAEYATLQKFADQESDFVDMYLRLIEISENRKDWPAVTKYAELLLAVNPLIAAPYTALGEAGSALGQNDVAINAYQKLLLLDPPDLAEVHYQLAKLLHARGGSEKEAKRHVLQALEEAPRFRDAQKLLLEIEGKEGAT